MLLKFGFPLLLIGVAAANPVLAQTLSGQPKGVVELFTSQGCASCPPADAALQKMIEKGDVIGLSFHVDYWNYLGWNDSLSSKENTERQYGYARALGRNGVYTPQAVLNGRDHAKGADTKAIYSKLDEFAASGKGLNVPVKSRLVNDEIEINIGAGQGKADIVVAYFNQQQMVDVTRGENKGRKISYWHSVYDVQTVGMWNGESMKVNLPASVLGKAKKGGCAVLLQTANEKGDPSAIIGASILMNDGQ